MRQRSPEERFWAKVVKTDSCWLWAGGENGKGYGFMKVVAGESPVYVHRFAYDLLVGPIPEGLTIDHLCRVRNCVNPDHLEAVTSRVNTLRGFGTSAQNARKTHCKNGHRFDAGNTRIKGDGWRECRSCKRLQKRTKPG